MRAGRLLVLILALIAVVTLVWFAVPGVETGVDDSPFAAYIGKEDHIAAGQHLYAAECAHCHGNLGEGFIGPNLTDRYWIHGSQNEDLYRVISEGALDAGMTGYQDLLTVEERSQLIAYIRSIEGTTPPNALEPEGEPAPEPSDFG